ncbi:hypothetical protein V8F20_007607 [Naviculisporaceae sp. PSN 640]
MGPVPTTARYPQHSSTCMMPRKLTSRHDYRRASLLTIISSPTTRSRFLTRRYLRRPLAPLAPQARSAVPSMRRCSGLNTGVHSKSPLPTPRHSPISKTYLPAANPRLEEFLWDRIQNNGEKNLIPAVDIDTGDDIITTWVMNSRIALRTQRLAPRPFSHPGTTRLSIGPDQQALDATETDGSRGLEINHDRDDRRRRLLLVADLRYALSRRNLHSFAATETTEYPLGVEADGKIDLELPEANPYAANPGSTMDNPLQCTLEEPQK